MRRSRIHNKKLKQFAIIASMIVVLTTSMIYIITSNKFDKNIVSKTMSAEENRVNDKNAIITNSDVYEEDNSKIAKAEILVVNKEISIDEEYVPENLVVPNVASNKEIKVTDEVAEYLEGMFEAAKNDGINLIVVSGYRSYGYQKLLFDESARINGLEHAKKYVAVPGYSEHHTGLAVDVISETYTMLDEGFENTKEFTWLQNNMSEYGFILRYPKGKEDITGYNYEPWHLRYVGEDIAEDIEMTGVTLEEYISEN